MLADDLDADIPPVLLQSALPDPLRQYLGSLHPSGMGGEYLPDLATQEVEIARITIASTTQDVTCVYARQAGDAIALRVVDEYDGGTLSTKRGRKYPGPLSLGELTKFFLRRWNLLDVLQMNFESDGYPSEESVALLPGKLRLLSRVRRPASIPRPEMAQAASGSLWSCRTRLIRNVRPAFNLQLVRRGILPESTKARAHPMAKIPKLGSA